MIISLVNCDRAFHFICPPPSFSYHASLKLFPLRLPVLDSMDSGDPDICMCCCLSIRLSDLLSVNVGLFDQYFRVVGEQIHTHLSAAVLLSSHHLSVHARRSLT